MSHKKVAILISGGGSNMVSLLESMTGDHPARPCLVLSNNADAGGLKKAAAAGVTTAVVDHRPFKGDREAFEAELVKPILEAGADIVCLAGFMRVLTAGFVSQFQGRMLNIHPSLLPKYKGLHTHARALEAGDKEHGCTVHEVTPALDDGPVLGQARVPILPGDTPEDLAQRVLVKEHLLYPAVLRRYAAGDRTPVLID
ncbi:phosphoribosylglycinamide formyltransferase [Phaeobacter gallaeciensis]|uniref:phosphoribosylglycinamide formyltransferase n=1 Tax=Phaeobacter gallaeciensis TaxID=60890 RepID=UPI00237F710E|nr:phosphoribosylglycinamide formyltransferase [Phaeobacter gallaeciensis]MDE4096234.1 phosphoribosylglycinamide formyltransferase [Phaeobacter gallaeciensis]MDE4105045.1 phosphoribosylglycinamide formyltransferase [Phaeobacter gallaeciensis]MDE4109501.1 phosphoribosylglycinamide formyltransferase [Phaeobacter gallaeciensis]MDE4113969.1 phosphoribosylglycinamide formyltransferase [Phaeobacter gallaeciensis]MDE4118436.1 phosphoribosylglycinamide formyltransferase [Phaeobacter gallaeciensis]